MRWRDTTNREGENGGIYRESLSLSLIWEWFHRELLSSMETVDAQTLTWLKPFKTNTITQRCNLNKITSGWNPISSPQTLCYCDTESTSLLVWEQKETSARGLRTSTQENHYFRCLIFHSFTQDITRSSQADLGSNITWNLWNTLSVCSSLPGVPDWQGLEFWNYSIGWLSQPRSIKLR